MGTSAKNVCDSCGDDIGKATLQDAVQITAMGTSELTTLMYLCVKPEYKRGSTVPKITGCARKVLTRATLTHLYEEVAKYTGDEDDKPFAL